MTFINPRALLREFVCDVVIFLYKIGEALLDATIRPYIVTAVCNDLFDGHGTPWLPWADQQQQQQQQQGEDGGQSSSSVVRRSIFNHSYADGASVCWRLDEVPEVSGVCTQCSEWRFGCCCWCCLK